LHGNFGIKKKNIQTSKIIKCKEAQRIWSNKRKVHGGADHEDPQGE
jgi:hypothetical protein